MVARLAAGNEQVEILSHTPASRGPLAEKAEAVPTTMTHRAESE